MDGAVLGGEVAAFYNSKQSWQVQSVFEGLIHHLALRLPVICEQFEKTAMEN